MIISRLTGGLGNQMFQYAAGLALAHQHLTVLKLDAGWFSIFHEPGGRRSRYALHCFNVQEQFATQEEIAWLLGQSGGICEKLAHRVAIALGMHRLSRVLGPNAGQLHTQQSEDSTRASSTNRTIPTFPERSSRKIFSSRSLSRSGCAVADLFSWPTIASASFRWPITA